MSADRYTGDDLALARRDGYELAVKLLRQESEAAESAGNHVGCAEIDDVADYLERVKEAILGA